LFRRSFREALGTVDCLGGILGLVSFLEELQAKLYLCFFGVQHYGRDTALEECRDGFECGHHVGWFRVVRSGATSL